MSTGCLHSDLEITTLPTEVAEDSEPEAESLPLLFKASPPEAIILPGTARVDAMTSAILGMVIQG